MLSVMEVGVFLIKLNGYHSWQLLYKNDYRKYEKNECVNDNDDKNYKEYN